MSRQRQQFGDPYIKKTGVRLVPIYEEMVGNVRTALWVLFGAVGMVLLIACSNLASLSLARASARHREMSIRKALGATSVRLARQLFVLVGLGLGLIGAFALTRLIRSLMFGVTQGDPLTFVAVSFLLIVIALAAGGLPAFRATKLDPLKALRD